MKFEKVDRIATVVGPNKGITKFCGIAWNKGKIPLFARFPYFKDVDEISAEKSKKFNNLYQVCNCSPYQYWGFRNLLNYFQIKKFSSSVYCQFICLKTTGWQVKYRKVQILTTKVNRYSTLLFTKILIVNLFFELSERFSCSTCQLGPVVNFRYKFECVPLQR